MAQPTTPREPARKDHLPFEARHLDDIEWETIRWPGETGKMLFHPRPERPTEPNAGILRLADAFDRRHDQRVKDLQVRRMGEVLNVKLLSSSECDVEIEEANRRLQLFESAFERSVKGGGGGAGSAAPSPRYAHQQPTRPGTGGRGSFDPSTRLHQGHPLFGYGHRNR